MFNRTNPISTSAHVVPDPDNSTPSRQVAPAPVSSVPGGTQARQPDRRPHYLTVPGGSQTDVSSARTSSDSPAGGQAEGAERGGTSGGQGRNISKTRSATSLRGLVSRALKGKEKDTGKDKPARNGEPDIFQLRADRDLEWWRASQSAGTTEYVKVTADLSEELLAAFRRKTPEEQDLVRRFIRDRKIADKRESKARVLLEKMGKEIDPKVTDKDIVGYMFDPTGDLQDEFRRFAVQEGLVDPAKLEAVKKREQEQERQLHEQTLEQEEESRRWAQPGRISFDRDSFS